MPQQDDHIACRTDRDVLVITILDARLNDYDQVRVMDADIQHAIGTSLTKNVAIDMSRVQMVTSVALFPFIHARGTAAAAGGKLVLCHMADQVLQVFTISQLLVESRPHAVYLALAEDLESAIAQLSGQ
jgi:anti-anti-sigma regulatory factor